MNKNIERILTKRREILWPSHVWGYEKEWWLNKIYLSSQQMYKSAEKNETRWKELAERQLINAQETEALGDWLARFPGVPK